MSKRPHGESASQHGSSPAKAAGAKDAVSSSSNGLPPINELLTPSEEPAQQEIHVKKPRNFIATVVMTPVGNGLPRRCTVSNNFGSRHAIIVV